MRAVTTYRLWEMKQRREKIAMLTSYDYSMARIVDAAGVDVILVGDSAANVMAGYETTVPRAVTDEGPQVHLRTFVGYRPRHRRFVTRHHIGRRVAHQNHIDPRRIHDAGHRIIVRSQHGDLLPALLHLPQTIRRDRPHCTLY